MSGRVPRQQGGGGRVTALGIVLVLILCLVAPAVAGAAELQVREVSLAACPREDPGTQPGESRSSGASCYALRGVVINSGSRPVMDTDVFARIEDASGEPVLPNRSRVGSIGDVAPGRSAFALRLAVPAGTPGPLRVRGVKARGFGSPVRSRAAPGMELLPLERQISGG